MKFASFACAAALCLSATTGAIAQPAPAPEHPYVLTASYLVGAWVDSESCSDGRVVFRANGTYTAPGGGTGNWRLDGNQLILGNGDDTLTLTVLPVNRDLIYTYNEDGTTGYSRRC